MIESSQRSKINEWYTQSLHEQFNPFIKLWISFNGWYNWKFPDAGADRKAINKCKQSGDLLTYYQRCFSDEQFCLHLDRLGKELNARPLENLTRARGKKLSLSKLEDEQGDISYLDNSSEAFKNYLEVIYRVRCNLFHCEKSPNNERDKLIVECGYKTLSVLMKQIINAFGGVE